MARIGANTCGVCGKNVSKYRCPACGILYCSLACNKAHKSGSNGRPPCSGKRARPGDETVAENRKRQREGVENGNKENIDFPARSTPCARKPRDQWRGGKIEENDEEEWQMSSDQQARLSGCEWLKSALRDPKLQGLLREIDGADDRETSLAFHRTDLQFGEFIDKVLLEIEEYRQGGHDEPELVANEP